MVEYSDVVAYKERRTRRGRLLEDARALASDMGAYGDVCVDEASGERG